ncbi:hypothetical protein [Aurantimonas manganoxydans]|uniref:hypothetical protein n=1 Tax=Aurantimonas manganoxydans TaxID=651183 RepID=UPI0011D1EF4A|nr:hypothetical protein [Aurantimonas manganoxydans]
MLLPSPIMATPAQFCIRENADAVVSFLNSLRRRLLRISPSALRALRRRVNPYGQSTGAPRWINRFIDFRPMTEVTPAAALVLAAEYDRARRLVTEDADRLGTLFLVALEQWRPEVVGVLRDNGFFHLLGIEAEPEFDSNADRIILPFISDTTDVQQEKVGLQLQKLIRIAQERGVETSDSMFDFAGPIGEAMENVVHAAYTDKVQFQYPHVGRWWMSSSIDFAKRQMQAAVYDQGATIAGTLKDWRFFPTFSSHFWRVFGVEFDERNPSYDSQVIAHAIEHSASMTGLSHRGKGLGMMKRFVDESGDGRLTILSRRGFYEFRPNEDPRIRQLPESVGGTLVEWIIRF